MTEPDTGNCQIDPQALQKIRDLQRPGKESVVLRIIDAYLASTPPLIDELNRALAGSDDQTAMRSAHTLKSSSAVLGATEFAAICLQIESLARENNLTAIPPLMTRFSALYTATCTALKALREREA